ncbi:MAG: ATP-dependent Clp protease adaptor ClpS [Phycisphaerales bacterium JB039]
MPTATETRTDQQTRVDRLTPWNVVLLNDDDHTYEYVIRMLGDLFGAPRPQAFKLARTVDSQGRAIVATTHRELAELKRDQIHGYGRDPLLAESAGSMTATIEPAEGG